jgi:hypothetical protein
MERTRRGHENQQEILTRLVSTDDVNRNANCEISAGAEQQSRCPVGGGVARKSDPELRCLPQAACALSGRAGPPGCVAASGRGVRTNGDSDQELSTLLLMQHPPTWCSWPITAALPHRAQSDRRAGRPAQLPAAVVRPLRTASCGAGRVSAAQPRQAGGDREVGGAPGPPGASLLWVCSDHALSLENAWKII